jgi:hypothetical protein
MYSSHTSLSVPTAFCNSCMVMKCKLYTGFKEKAFAVTDNLLDTKNWLNTVDAFHIRVIPLDGNTDTFVYVSSECFL